MASSVTIDGNDVIDLLGQREPAFTTTEPLLKTVSAGGISLGIDPDSTVTAFAFSTGNFRIAEDTARLLKFQINEANSGGRWQNAAVLEWDTATRGTMQIDRLKANVAAQITIDDALLVSGSVTCGALTADTMSIGSMNTMALTTAAITAAGTSGVLLLTKDGVPGFALEDDAVCRTYSDLHVVGRMTVAESVTTGDYEMTTLANGSLAIQKAVTGHAYIPHGTYTTARFDVSALFGGSTFTDAIATDVADHVTHVSDSVFRQDLHVLGNVTCEGTTPSPFWIAGNIDSEGTIFKQKGKHTFTCSKLSTCIYDIYFPTHPDGASYTVLLASTEYHAMYRFPTSTYMRIYLLNSSNSFSPQGGGIASVAILI